MILIEQKINDKLNEVSNIGNDLKGYVKEQVERNINEKLNELSNIVNEPGTRNLGWFLESLDKGL